jgi:hypothetical protein
LRHIRVPLIGLNPKETFMKKLTLLAGCTLLTGALSLPAFAGGDTKDPNATNRGDAGAGAVTGSSGTTVDRSTDANANTGVQNPDRKADRKAKRDARRQNRDAQTNGGAVGGESSGKSSTSPGS